MEPEGGRGFLRQALDESDHVADGLPRLVNTAIAPIFGIGTDGGVTQGNRMTAEIPSYGTAGAGDKPLVKSFIALECKEQVDWVCAEALQGGARLQTFRQY